MWEKIKMFIYKDWTLEEKVLLLADVLLAGVLIGWLTAPFKGGIFSNNTIDSHYDQLILEEDDEEDMEE